MIQRTLNLLKPVVAFESTVLTHGLPYPENVRLAHELEDIVREVNAVPVTIGVIDGKIIVGLDDEQLEYLCEADEVQKISARDFAGVMVKKSNGGTTVAGTLLVAGHLKMRVFSTGGIGGVHRKSPFDISADLQMLAKKPVIVVCAGAKAILDLPATLEYLETISVPVVGYQTDEFPAFYSAESGLSVQVRADTPEEIVEIANAHWSMGMKSSILVAVPPPINEALNAKVIEGIIEQAMQESVQKNIHGQSLTPFLLSRVSELSGGESLRVNLSLLKNNSRVAAQISHHLYIEDASRKFRSL
jgi:pseudouridine-5'-phosphate glycosidase